jgi:enoyl-CoA hydratase/carnithine racemase
VNTVLPDAELLAHATARARTLAAQPAPSVLITKSLLRKGADARLEDTMAEEFALFTELLEAPEARAIVAAFLEKRRASRAGEQS